jgi:hypothetical protein
MRIAIITVIIIQSFLSCVYAQNSKRNRGEGFYQTLVSNTTGSGNIWINGMLTGFIWANKTADSASGSGQTPGYFPFFDASSEIGIMDYTSLVVESRMLSYTRNNMFQFGNISGGIKLTIPDKGTLRLNGFGFIMKYIWNSPEDTFPSLAGYRVGTTGFAPEGYIVDGSNLQFKFIYESDIIASYSWLPLKLCINAGMNIPFKKADYVAKQFLFNTALGYFGFQYDAFIEYSLEAFNNFTNPRIFDNLGHTRTQVCFSENPMYLSIGGRVHYSNGISLFACVPVLLSANSGSAMTYKDKILLNRSAEPGAIFYDEYKKGITDPFDPWFAKWKIVMKISFPLLYRQTGSEMMRSFLLLKNKRIQQTIDIDKKLQTFDKPDKTDSIEELEREKRLEAIRKRREQAETPEQ